jgi:hypothetical protein
MIENFDDLRKYDTSKMFQVLLDFPEQIKKQLKLLIIAIHLKILTFCRQNF